MFLLECEILFDDHCDFLITGTTLDVNPSTPCAVDPKCIDLMCSGECWTHGYWAVIEDMYNSKALVASCSELKLSLTAWALISAHTKRGVLN